jgi:hypothetical protein
MLRELKVVGQRYRAVLEVRSGVAAARKSPLRRRLRDHGSLVEC